MTLTSGQLLAQRYRLGRRIAVGGMGEVWAAADTRLERQVAVKVLKPELSNNPEFRRRFHTEARMTASLNHPGIAAVHDYGETPSDPRLAYSGAYLVMELVDGDPLATILERQPRLPVDRTLDILGQAADALQVAHQRGLVHRDVKPGNILITSAGKVKLTDFGIARAVDAAPLTQHGMVMGTAHYIAPEQAAGADSGPAGDVYSLAVVGYECLAGQRPFEADNPITLAMMHIRDQPPPLPPDVPAGVRALIEATLVKDPRQRYGTGGELAAAVAAVRAGHRPPLPAGLAGSKATEPKSRSHPPPTALLPPEGLSGSGSGPAVARRPPTTALAGSSYPTSRRPRRRGTARVGMVLLGMLALVLAGYLVREALRSGTDFPGPGLIDAIRAPSSPAVPAPFRPEPAQEQRPPESSDTDGGFPAVFINPDDYVGKRGDEAAFTAKSQGLEPQVIDEDGDQIDRDRRSRCRIIGVDARSRVVPRGSDIELICSRRGR